MPTIKMKKGYPDSTGHMHDKHADAIKSQCRIDMLDAIKKTPEPIEVVDFINTNTDAVKNYIKYCVEPAKKSAPKKKTTKK